VTREVRKKKVNDDAVQRALELALRYLLRFEPKNHQMQLLKK